MHCVTSCCGLKYHLVGGILSIMFGIEIPIAHAMYPSKATKISSHYIITPKIKVVLLLRWCLGKLQLIADKR